LFAIESALAAGADAIELDVHRSSDGVLVICHDPTLDRTTDLRGAIATHSFSEIAEADGAFWFVPGRGALRDEAPEAYVYRGVAPTDPRFRVASLEAVLVEFPDVLLNLDIKQGAPTVPAYEVELADLLVRHNRIDDVIVTSFADHSIKVFHEHSPQIGTAPGTTALTMIVQAIRSGSAVPTGLLDGFVALQVPLKVAGVWLVDERLVAAAHGLGLALHVWTVDDEADMSKLIDLGVDGIMTDVPSLLAATLGRGGTALAGT
jgi:glycerophosphoryl diester phosphodiesterase